MLMIGTCNIIYILIIKIGKIAILYSCFSQKCNDVLRTSKCNCK